MDKNTNIDDGVRENLQDQINYLMPNTFELVIDALKFKNVEYTVQSVSLPEISTAGSEVSHAFHGVGVRPDKVEFSPLTLTFLIDENMLNYKEIYDWIISTVVADETTKQDRDLTLLINTSANNLNKQIRFINAYPISLSGIPFNFANSDTETMVGEVSFKFDRYDIL